MRNACDPLSSRGRSRSRRNSNTVHRPLGSYVFASPECSAIPRHVKVIWALLLCIDISFQDNQSVYVAASSLKVDIAFYMHCFGAPVEHIAFC